MAAKLGRYKLACTGCYCTCACSRCCSSESVSMAAKFWAMWRGTPSPSQSSHLRVTCSQAAHWCGASQDYAVRGVKVQKHARYTQIQEHYVARHALTLPVQPLARHLQPGTTNLSRVLQGYAVSRLELQGQAQVLQTMTGVS